MFMIACADLVYWTLTLAGDAEIKTNSLAVTYLQLSVVQKNARLWTVLLKFFMKITTLKGPTNPMLIQSCQKAQQVTKIRFSCMHALF